MALAALALACLTACGRKPDAPAQTGSETPRNVVLTAAQLKHVSLYTVAPSGFARTIEAAGVVDFDNNQATSVVAPFSGPVTRLLVEPGQQVRAGQPLAMVASPDFSAAVGAYAKALATARTDRKLADADKDLVQHNGISQREAQQAETDAANAEADRDAALQALVALNIDPATIRAVQAGRQMARVEGVIRAPIAGTVVDKLITPGQFLQAGSTPSFTVANLSKVWVMAQTPPSDLPFIAVGDPAEVETGVGAAVLNGAVDNVSSVVNPDTRAIGARISVANPRGLLKKQMYVRVRIKSRQRISGLLVPVAAILRDDENLPFVFVRQPDGSFARRRVTLGERAGDLYNIPEGLHAGDQVVTDGGIFVQFMQSQ
jgi:cobalt-zinc-cadmium efflux system membrane fusion protein